MQIIDNRQKMVDNSFRTGQLMNQILQQHLAQQNWDKNFGEQTRQFGLGQDQAAKFEADRMEMERANQARQNAEERRRAEEYGRINAVRGAMPGFEGAPLSAIPAPAPDTVGFEAAPSDPAPAPLPHPMEDTTPKNPSTVPSAAIQKPSAGSFPGMGVFPTRTESLWGPSGGDRMADIGASAIQGLARMIGPSATGTAPDTTTPVPHAPAAIPNISPTLPPVSPRFSIDPSLMSPDIMSSAPAATLPPVSIPAPVAAPATTLPPANIPVPMPVSTPPASRYLTFSEGMAANPDGTKKHIQGLMAKGMSFQEAVAAMNGAASATDDPMSPHADATTVYALLEHNTPPVLAQDASGVSRIDVAATMRQKIGLMTQMFRFQESQLENKNPENRKLLSQATENYSRASTTAALLDDTINRFDMAPSDEDKVTAVRASMGALTQSLGIETIKSLEKKMQYNFLNIHAMVDPEEHAHGYDLKGARQELEMFRSIQQKQAAEQIQKVQDLRSSMQGNNARLPSAGGIRATNPALGNEYAPSTNGTTKTMSNGAVYTFDSSRNGWVRKQ